jgi:hypothetical protein
MVGLPRRPKLSQLRSIRIRQTYFLFVLNLPKEIHNRWTGTRDPEKKGKGEGRRVRGAIRNHARGSVSLFPFLLTCQTHKAGGGAIRGAAIVGVCGADQESAIPRGLIQRSAIRGEISVCWGAAW